MLYIHLFHGRRYPGEDLAGWGADGPTFRAEWASLTYRSSIRFGSDHEDGELRFVEDLIYYDGMYYGDVSISEEDEHPLPFVEFNDALALPPETPPLPPPPPAPEPPPPDWFTVTTTIQPTLQYAPAPLPPTGQVPHEWLIQWEELRTPAQPTAMPNILNTTHYCPLNPDHLCYDARAPGSCGHVCHQPGQPHYICTRTIGHDGDHIACDNGDNHGVHRWPQALFTIPDERLPGSHDCPAIANQEHICYDTEAPEACGHRHPNNYLCTRVAGHAGEHMACTGGDGFHDVARWHNDDDPTTIPITDQDLAPTELAPTQVLTPPPPAAPTPMTVNLGQVEVSSGYRHPTITLKVGESVVDLSPSEIHRLLRVMVASLHIPPPAQLPNPCGCCDRGLYHENAHIERCDDCAIYATDFEAWLSLMPLGERGGED